jgi:hypothetical protein
MGAVPRSPEDVPEDEPDVLYYQLATPSEHRLPGFIAAVTRPSDRDPLGELDQWLARYNSELTCVVGPA